MSLSNLSKLMPPPVQPIGRSAIAWSKVAIEAQFEFPVDYREFIDLYGSGAIDNFLWILQPTDANPNLSVVHRKSRIIAGFRDLRDQFGVAFPSSVKLSDSDVVPWGVTDNGDVLFWQLGSDLKAKSIAVVDAEGRDWDFYLMDMSTFLEQLVRREVHPSAFPIDFPSEHPVFCPA